MLRNLIKYSVLTAGMLLFLASVAALNGEHLPMCVGFFAMSVCCFLGVNMAEDGKWCA